MNKIMVGKTHHSFKLGGCEMSQVLETFEVKEIKPKKKIPKKFYKFLFLLDGTALFFWAYMTLDNKYGALDVYRGLLVFCAGSAALAPFWFPQLEAAAKYDLHFTRPKLAAFGASMFVIGILLAIAVSYWPINLFYLAVAALFLLGLFCLAGAR
jgi:hypothetical protein